MYSSTTIAPRAPSLTPAVAASAVFGRTPATTRTRSTRRLNVVLAKHPQAAGLGVDRLDLGGGDDLHVVPFELGPEQGAELGVHRRKHLGQCLDLGDAQAAHGQRLGHLQPDVARADDQRRPRAALVEETGEGKVSPMSCSRCTPLRGP